MASPSVISTERSPPNSITLSRFLCDEQKRKKALREWRRPLVWQFGTYQGSHTNEWPMRGPGKGPCGSIWGREGRETWAGGQQHALAQSHLFPFPGGEVETPRIRKNDTFRSAALNDHVVTNVDCSMAFTRRWCLQKSQEAQLMSRWCTNTSRKGHSQVQVSPIAPMFCYRCHTPKYH